MKKAFFLLVIFLFSCSSNKKVKNDVSSSRDYVQGSDSTVEDDLIEGNVKNFEDKCSRSNLSQIMECLNSAPIDKRKEIFINPAIGSICHKNKDYSCALYYYFKGLSSVKNQANKAWLYMMISKVQLKMGKLSKAINYAKEANKSFSSKRYTFHYLSLANTTLMITMIQPLYANATKFTGDLSYSEKLILAQSELILGEYGKSYDRLTGMEKAQAPVNDYYYLLLQAILKTNKANSPEAKAVISKIEGSGLVADFISVMRKNVEGGSI